MSIGTLNDLETRWQIQFTAHEARLESVRHGRSGPLGTAHGKLTRNVGPGRSQYAE
jgi:hypothetical protein